MKTKSIIVGGLVFLFSTAFIASNAQSSNPTIKVLPSSKEGAVKLLVVGSTERSVEVKFFNEDGFLQGDEIEPVSAGFNKKYILKKFMKNDIWMEVTAEGTSVTYQLANTDNKLVPHLVKTTQTYPVVASNQ